MKYHQFHNLSSVQIMLIFFINHALKFAYQPGHLKVKRQSSGLLQKLEFQQAPCLKIRQTIRLMQTAKKGCGEDGLRYI